MTVYPLVVHLGPFTVTGYGLMMMVAFLMAGWAIQLDLRRRGGREEFAADIVMAAVIGGLVGAKLWYVLLTGDWSALLRRGGVGWDRGLFWGGARGVGGGGAGRGPPPPCRRTWAPPPPRLG